MAKDYPKRCDCGQAYRCILGGNGWIQTAAELAKIHRKEARGNVYAEDGKLTITAGMTEMPVRIMIKTEYTSTS